MEPQPDSGVVEPQPRWHQGLRWSRADLSETMVCWTLEWLCGLLVALRLSYIFLAEDRILPALDALGHMALYMFGVLCAGLLVLRLSARRRKLGFVVFLAQCFVFFVLFIVMPLADYSFWATAGVRLDYYVIQTALLDLETYWDVAMGSTPDDLKLYAGGLGLLALVGVVASVVLWRMGQSFRAEGARARDRALLIAALLAAALSQTPSCSAPAAHAAEHITVVVAAEAMLARWRADAQDIPDAAPLPVPPRDRNPLLAAPPTQRKPYNVVVLLLESTSYKNTSLMPGGPHVTPTLAALAQDPHAIVGHRFYTVMTSTTKAIISTLCGMEPFPHLSALENRYGVPTKCLPAMLKEVGYRTGFFYTSPAAFDQIVELTATIGFEHTTSQDSLLAAPRQPGLEYQMSYLGAEDLTMLKPVDDFLTARGDKPFLLSFLTLASHHDYSIPDRFPVEDLIPPHRAGSGARHVEYNKHLNAIRYVDQFNAALIALLKKHGVWDDTIFIIVGDHGEAFGEHQQYQHCGVGFEEVLRVPMVMRLPPAVTAGQRGPLTEPATQLDLMPTILHALGLDPGAHPSRGRSLLLPYEPRARYATCSFMRYCLVKLDGDHKYVYYYGKSPSVMFDLKADPDELDPVVLDDERAAQLARELLMWRQSVLKTYTHHHAEP